VAARGDLYAAAGEVVAVYGYRDRVMAPFPMIEIACGSLGAMSGGAAFDQFGHVVGILSSGWRDAEPPSNVAWIIHALMFAVDLRWPPGLYEPETPILELPDELLTIVGRDNVKLTEGSQGRLHALALARTRRPHSWSPDRPVVPSDDPLSRFWRG
jgi:hypothetical protein